MAALYYGLEVVRPLILSHSLFPYILAMFVVFTTLFHVGLVRAGKISDQAFVRYYMGATTGKLFFYMAVIISYALYFETDIPSFILLFFMLYVFFTSFEVAYVYRKLTSMKAKSSKPADS